MSEQTRLAETELIIFSIQYRLYSIDYRAFLVLKYDVITRKLLIMNYQCFFLLQLIVVVTD